MAHKILDELNRKHAWFKAKKTGFLWAKKLTAKQEIQTLEGTVTAEPGAMLCRGVAGELWPQQEERLLARYQPTKMTDGDWVKYIPKPNQPPVLAARVRTEFLVNTSFGVLHGKAGDYLLKNLADEHNEYPDDLWVVDKKLFNKTYSRVLTSAELLVATQVMSSASAQ